MSSGLPLALHKRLSQVPVHRGAAAGLIYEVWRHAVAVGNSDLVSLDAVRQVLWDYIQRNSLTELINDRLNYAINLASGEGDLIYEDMDKLFSLCDQIKVLTVIGMLPDEALYSEWRTTLAARFAQKPPNAREVAYHRVEEWKRDWTWYAENMGQKEKRRGKHGK